MSLASVVARWLQDDRPIWETVQEFERAVAEALTRSEADHSNRTETPSGYTAPAWLMAEFDRINKAPFYTVNEQRAAANAKPCV